MYEIYNFEARVFINDSTKIFENFMELDIREFRTSDIVLSDFKNKNLFSLIVSN